MAHIIGNVLVPCQIQMGFSVFPGTYGVLPLPAGDKIAPRQPQSRKSRLLQSLDEILTEPLGIRGGMFGAVHAAIHNGADGLQKGAVQPGRDFPNGKSGM